MSRELCVGERVRFDGKHITWNVRAVTSDGRYALLTAAQFGDVYYTIIDWEPQRAFSRSQPDKMVLYRGAMNVIGGGLDIFTNKGDDPAVDDAIKMLESGEWELSTRNRVELNITDYLDRERDAE